MQSIVQSSAFELWKKIKNGELTSRKIVTTCLEQIQNTDSLISAFLDIYQDDALEAADRIDEQYKSGRTMLPLAGIPIAIKDNHCISGKKTTCASKILENFVSPYTATAVQKLLDRGLIPIGKTNMDEFAMGSSTENSAFQRTKNPWDIDCVPGGSSGGSAASVAVGQVPLSLGSDTGGSIRQPAAFCGIVGLKPTYGRVSRFGLVAFASSLDQIGPFGRTVEDVAHVLTVICGADPLDSTSSLTPVPDFSASLENNPKGLKIGVPESLLSDAIDGGVLEAVHKALETLKHEGLSWNSVRMESLNVGVSTYYIVAPAEASANLARYDGVRYGYRDKSAHTLRQMVTSTRKKGFGAEVKRRILLGTFALSSGYYDAYYLKAQKARTYIKNEFTKLFNLYDVIVTPTAPTVAFKLGEKSEDPLAMYLSDIATIPVNLAGLPAISIPCGFSNGLPVGLQIIGKPWAEETILNIAHRFQQTTDFHQKSPTVKISQSVIPK